MNILKTQIAAALLCAAILSSCATPAEHAAKEKKYREDLARVEAYWARMSPEQRRVAKLREAVFSRRSASTNDGRRPR